MIRTSFVVLQTQRLPSGPTAAVDSMRALREALKTLKKNGVELEDPGDEIGPTSSGSPNMGLWFHDPDGYRWELSVENGARES